MNRDVATSVVRNTTIMMASQAITWISSFVLMMFLPKYLGSEEYGRLYVAISLTLMAQVFIDFGGQYLVAKEVSRSHKEAPGLVVNSGVVRSILWLVALAGMCTFALAAGYSKEVTVLIFILGCSKLWEAFERILTSCFQGVELMQYPCLGAIVERVFVTVAGVAALLAGGKAVIIALAMALSTLLNFAVVYRSGKRFFKPLPPAQWSEIKNLMKLSLPYFLYSIFSIIYYRIDAVMLSIMTPDTVVGWYGAAYRFFDILMFFPNIISTAIFPVMAKSWGKEMSTLAQTTQRSLEFVLLGGIPVTVIVFTYSRNIIEFFFGMKEYGPSVALLQILTVGLLLVYVDFVLGTTLFASDRQRQWTWTALLALFVNPALNLILIPYAQNSFGNGGAGAAVATILTEFLVMVMAVKFLPTGILDGLRTRVCAKAAAAGLAMTVVIIFLQSTGIQWMAGAAVSLAIYVVALVAFKTAEKSEVTFIRDFFSVQNLKRAFALAKGA